MEVKPGYKQTEVGVIPEDWKEAQVDDLAVKVGSGVTPRGGNANYRESGRPFVRSQNVGWGQLLLDDLVYIDDDTHRTFLATELCDLDVLLNITGASIGRCAIANSYVAGGNVNQHVCIIRTAPGRVAPQFVSYLLLSELGQRQIESFQAGGNRQGLNFGQIRSIRLPLPPTKREQEAIATTLSDVDALLDGLDRLIVKKRDLKQAVMQQLLTGQTRLPGFHGEWEVNTLETLADCLDGVRVPLNETQRAQMRGDVPYCGANGVLDYVSGYVIDDDIILMAEDGGYFDEYATRPIAYRMKGKCWVNNHAHILKAKSGYDQGFLFHSLVHKNILPFLASGTRAKLNKSKMTKIEIRGPVDEAEQTAIAAALSDMDAELAALEARRDKTLNLKHALMQELLTGKTRLVPAGARDA